MPLDKIYDPSKIEEKWAALWAEPATFQADPASSQPPFSMVIPPPNVTGSLHLGHALNTTLQDILARYKRMKGFNVLWVPGTDHAGIATQNVVERQLAKEGMSRHDIGREAFIEKVWDWKKTSGGTIISQLKRLGASCDWSRERFTLDEGLSCAVTEVFVRLYQEGLIYRDKRLINFCFRCQTALSDIEVEHEETNGKMYHIKYPLADGSDYLIVATTRPETMLADTAVAVHPEDERYNFLIGKDIALPLTDRTIPIVGDSILVDREFGTGAVKITPGHDFNDEAAGKRHQLNIISLFDSSGRVALLNSLTIFEARAEVVKRLEAQELLIKIEDHRHAIGVCYRCKTVVEPTLSTQWFVRMNDPENSLVKPAISAVQNGEIRLIPDAWKNNYLGWMENIQDWCISRQIWWGHKIPAWYCHGNDKDQRQLICNQPIVSATTPKECPHCGSTDLRQDPDVLDTWFSSALWPFSTLGWPEKTPLLKKFYPTTTLISGFDILFFWVARMIMMGLHFTKQVPFRDVYIHALVRDAQGQKMSKSKGNVIDPLEIMGRYGTDALRFTLASMASPGRDIKLSEDRIEGYRNFSNKIWNAARFILMNAETVNEASKPIPTLPPLEGEEQRASSNVPPLQGGVGGDGFCSNPADIWIRIRLSETIQSVENAMDRYRMDEAAEILYQFVWHEYCDWYLELSKVTLQDDEKKEDTIRTMTSVFADILALLHPFMPFITAELSADFTHKALSFPKSDPTFSSHPNCVATAASVQVLITTISEIRNRRGEMNIPPSEKMELLVDGDAQKISEYLPYIKRLAGIEKVEFRTTPPGVPFEIEHSSFFGNEWGIFHLLLDEAHVKKECERLAKVLQKIEKELSPLRNRVNAPDFSKVPAEVQETLRLRLTEMEQKKDQVIAQLSKMR
ncbi:MAG: valine--tRNA ligase [Nitrospirota bacterium]